MLTLAPLVTNTPMDVHPETIGRPAVQPLEDFSARAWTYDLNLANTQQRCRFWDPSALVGCDDREIIALANREAHRQYRDAHTAQIRRALRPKRDGPEDKPCLVVRLPDPRAVFSYPQRAYEWVRYHLQNRTITYMSGSDPLHYQSEDIQGPRQAQGRRRWPRRPALYDLEAQFGTNPVHSERRSTVSRETSMSERPTTPSPVARRNKSLVRSDEGTSAERTMSGMHTVVRKGACNCY